MNERCNSNGDGNGNDDDGNDDNGSDSRNNRIFSSIISLYKYLSIMLWLLSLRIVASQIADAHFTYTRFVSAKCSSNEYEQFAVDVRTAARHSSAEREKERIRRKNNIILLWCFGFSVFRCVFSIVSHRFTNDKFHCSCCFRYEGILNGEHFVCSTQLNMLHSTQSRMALRSP